MNELADPGLLTFSPVECLVGGIFIGISAAARVFVTGHVTGISGILRNALRKFYSIEKVRQQLLLYITAAIAAMPMAY